MSNPDAIFIRHSESTGNAEKIIKGTKNYPLDSRGKEESMALAAQIARYRPTVVLSSPLDRAKHPAQLIAKKAGVKLKIDKGLLPPDLGNLTGTPQKTGEPAIRKAFKSPDKPIGKTGDTPAAWDAKNTSTIRKINVMITRGERPAVVTHSRNLRELPHTIQGKPLQDPTKGGPEPSGFVLLKGKNLVTHKGAA